MSFKQFTLGGDLLTTMELMLRGQKVARELAAALERMKTGDTPSDRELQKLAQISRREFESVENELTELMKGLKSRLGENVSFNGADGANIHIHVHVNAAEAAAGLGRLDR